MKLISYLWGLFTILYPLYFSQRPCAGRDCSGGCQCFPEKGSRKNMQRLNQFSLGLFDFLYLAWVLLNEDKNKM
uniref:Uncharacterized protein n=1 Tax=Crocodylus porosus TaxID=8502 RepID=A0A7M4FEZ1_CROPO